MCIFRYKFQDIPLFIEDVLDLCLICLSIGDSSYVLEKKIMNHVITPKHRN